jgi:hypothetical protein
MSVADFYGPSRQFTRALNRDWRLHSIDLLCGVLYAVVSFYVGHRVGHSQVYSVIVPFLVTAGFMVYLTRRLCVPEVKRDSAASYFNLPQNRLMALDAHVVFLCIAILWLTGCVFVGSGLKLGGAGMTACYRFHPEFVVLPWFATALVIRHIYRIRNLAFWGQSLVWYVLLASWVVFRCWGILSLPSHAGNNYWPDRSVSLNTEWAWTAIFAALTVWLVYNTRIQWRQREIGGIR